MKSVRRVTIRLLAEGACQGVRVSELTKDTQLSRPAVSHHLKILKDAKIVDYHSEGTKNYYYLIHETQKIDQLKKLLDGVVQRMQKP